MGKKARVKEITSKGESKGRSTFSNAMPVIGKEERAGTNMKVTERDLHPPRLVKILLEDRISHGSCRLTLSTRKEWK